MSYRKICQKYYGYTTEQMKGMDVHHVDGNHANNDPLNLRLITPEEHAKIHEHEFVLWAREGSKKGNESFRYRLATKGKTEKEKAYQKKRIEMCKKGLHRKPHSEKTKKIISEKKKAHLSDKKNHPMYGRTTYKLTSPSGEIIIVNEDWKQWCMTRNLCASNLIAVAKGKRKHHKGWKAEIV